MRGEENYDGSYLQRLSHDAYESDYDINYDDFDGVDYITTARWRRSNRSTISVLQLPPVNGDDQIRGSLDNHNDLRRDMYQ